jgi:hypothetical protein
MMQIIPTYVVKWMPPRPGNAPQEIFRVPETELDSFLRVLRFNGVKSFSAEIEGDDGH